MRTIRAVQFLVVMMFFLVLMITTIMPAIELVAQVIAPINQAQAAGDGTGGSLAITGVIDTTLQAVLVAMPLIFMGGIFVVVFMIGTGLRGTSR